MSVLDFLAADAQLLWGELYAVKASSEFDKRFVTAYRSALASLHKHGARETVEALVRS